MNMVESPTLAPTEVFADRGVSKSRKRQPGRMDEAAQRHTSSAQTKCPISAFQKVICGKHKFRILWALRSGALGYGQLRREVSNLGEIDIVARVLTRELRALERCGLIIRTPLPGKRARVGYRLSEFGGAFVPLLERICDWASIYLQFIPSDELQKDVRPKRDAK